MSDFPQQLDRRPPTAPRGPRRPGKGVIAAGLAVALVLGVAGGLAMKPKLNDQALGKQTQHRVVPLPREPSGLGIVVDRTVTAITQQPPLPVTPVGPQAPAPYPDPAVAAEPRARPRPPSPVVVGSIPERNNPPVHVVRPAFDCRFARSMADRLVCVDPRLAAADRRMAQAYHHALDVGVPEEVLRRQQEAWLDARDQAAREGPEALADIYGQRIAELQGMARY
jgi:hypothetical protein